MALLRHCDICDKILPDATEYSVIKLDRYRINGVLDKDGHNNVIKKDICSECSEEIEKYIENMG